MAVTAEELLNNRYGSGVGQGWNALGAALMGNGAHRDQVWQQNYMLGQRAHMNDISISEKLAMERVHRADAVKKEAENIARIKNRQNMIDNGVDPRQAGIIDGNFAAGYNPNIAYEAMRNAGRLSADQDAYNAMKNGDVEMGNRYLAVGSGHPLAVTHEQGGVVFNPYAPASSQTFQPTPIGQAMLGKSNAGTAAQLALAAKRGAIVNGVVSDTTGTYGNVQTPTGPAIVDFDSSLPQTTRDAMAQAVTTGNPLSDAMHGMNPPAGAPGRWSVQVNPASPQANIRQRALTKDEAARLFPDDDTYRAFQMFRYQGANGSHPEYLDADRAAMAFLDSRKFDDVRSDMTIRQPDQPGLLSRILSGAAGDSTTSTPVDPANQVSGADAVTVTDKPAYDLLPSGALWRDAEGNLRRKR